MTFLVLFTLVAKSCNPSHQSLCFSSLFNPSPHSHDLPKAFLNYLHCVTPFSGIVAWCFCPFVGSYLMTGDPKKSFSLNWLLRVQGGHHLLGIRLMGERLHLLQHIQTQMLDIYLGHHLRPNAYIYLCVSSSTTSWNIQVFSCQEASSSTLTIHRDIEEFSFMTSRHGDLLILNCSIISSLFFIHFSLV